ncbi:MAG: DNA replication/repair protein RecF [Tissierellia bacterium]|nr:DNA replication/repair protein RecF [Tissierellia bacterium]
MIIQKLQLCKFRNYDSVEIYPNEQLNLFIGKNASGKTNLLESISMVLTGKSFKTNRDVQMINFDEEDASILSKVLIDGLDIDLELNISKSSKKKIKINGNDVKRVSELTENTSIVIFTPEDLELIKEGPALRRKFIDGLISSVNLIYSYNLSRYKKILNDRNDLLKNPRRNLDNDIMLGVYNIQISTLGNYIINERVRFIEILNKIAKIEHSKISDNREELNIVYNSNINRETEGKSNQEKEYLRQLENSIQRDKYYRNTNLGPHRDDIEFYINGKDLKIYGSQGQQRSVILSLKLSEAILYKMFKNISPIIILDDVFSELDIIRREKLISSVENYQTFISMTDDMKVDEFNKYEKSIYSIKDREVEKL